MDRFHTKRIDVYPQGFHYNRMSIFGRRNYGTRVSQVLTLVFSFCVDWATTPWGMIVRTDLADGLDGTRTTMLFTFVGS